MTKPNETKTRLQCSKTYWKFDRGWCEFFGLSLTAFLQIDQEYTFLKLAIFMVISSFFFWIFCFPSPEFAQRLCPWSQNMAKGLSPSIYPRWKTAQVFLNLWVFKVSRLLNKARKTECMFYSCLITMFALLLPRALLYTLPALVHPVITVFF